MCYFSALTARDANAPKKEIETFVKWMNSARPEWPDKTIESVGWIVLKLLIFGENGNWRDDNAFGIREWSMGGRLIGTGRYDRRLDDNQFLCCGPILVFFPSDLAGNWQRGKAIESTMKLTPDIRYLTNQTFNCFELLTGLLKNIIISFQFENSKKSAKKIKINVKSKRDATRERPKGKIIKI